MQFVMSMPNVVQWGAAASRGGMHRVVDVLVVWISTSLVLYCMY